MSRLSSIAGEGTLRHCVQPPRQVLVQKGVVGADAVYLDAGLGFLARTGWSRAGGVQDEARHS